MKKHIFILFFLTICSLAVVSPLYAQTEKDSTDKKTDYEKLFEDKKVKTTEGMITLHKIDGKVYFEFPKKLLGDKMLVGSVVEATSHSDDAAAGEQPNPPLPVYFTMSDSTVHMREARFFKKVSDGNQRIKQALDKSTIGPIVESFSVKAVSPDSSAFVFNATKFFVNGNKAIDPFGPYGGNSGMFESTSSTYNNSRSLLSDIMAYEDNITVSSYLSFDVKKSVLGFSTEARPGTYLMKRSLILLPEEPARPRINDPRIGIFYTRQNQYAAKGNGTEPVYYANRWDLKPKDVEAFKNGELVEPVEPITFYIDDKFPDEWIEYIEKGAKDWNTAFEEIGYKNAIVTKMYPEDDPNFDPNNLKYTTIKYSATPKENAMGPSWVDPRSGEILSATVYIYHGITDLLNNWIFRYTAAADERARTTKIPDKLIGEGLRYVVAHEVGHTVGLMHNMGASSAFPTDSLRSPLFTQKYGTTPSIMDYARYNVVAQPGDYKRGIKLTPPRLGVYDEYAIEWLYTPVFEADTPREEVPTLDRWISEKIDDPRYRYGKQQVTGIIDPSAQTEDLGGDHIKTAKYAIENFKYIMRNVNDWVKDEDHDLSFRTRQHFWVINIYFFWPLSHVMNHIGGIYQNEVYATDNMPAYEVVSEKKQHESTMFILRSLEDLSWMNNAILSLNSNEINDRPGEFMRKILTGYLIRTRMDNLALSESKAIGDTYTREKFMSDIFNFAWGETMEGQESSEGKQSMQTTLTDILIFYSNVEKAPSVNPFALAKNDKSSVLFSVETMSNNKPIPSSLYSSSQIGIQDLIQMQKNKGGEVSGFGYFPGVVYKEANIDHLYYKWLLKTKDILEDVVEEQSGDLKTKYEYMLLKVNRALETD